jgi:4-hydroxybenzoate polyprenyltransferase
MDDGEPTNGRRGQSFALAVVVAFCSVSIVRLSSAALHFIPRWVALIIVVFAGLELVSVAWNISRRDPWNEETFFDRISNVLMYLPWW